MSTMITQASRASMPSTTFERFAGLCAVLTGIAGFLYAIAFIVLKNSLLYSLLLMVSGVLTTAVVVSLYNTLRETDASFSLWALFLSGAGALGSAVHGGYDLANAVNPINVPAAAQVSQIDPRGLLTFGLLGLGILVMAWLIDRSDRLPRRLGYLGYVLGILLVLIYLGRLVIVDTNNLLLGVPVLLAGFVISPLWYVWLGMSLWRERSA